MESGLVRGISPTRPKLAISRDHRVDVGRGDDNALGTCFVGCGIGGNAWGVIIAAAGWQMAVSVFKVGRGQSQLSEVISGLRPAGGLTGLLNSGKNQRDQDGDDGNHDEQFNQGKTKPLPEPAATGGQKWTAGQHK